MRVVVHKSTELKREEIDGCFDAWRTVEDVELIQIQQDSGVFNRPAASGQKGRRENTRFAGAATFRSAAATCCCGRRGTRGWAATRTFIRKAKGYPRR